MTRYFSEPLTTTMETINSLDPISQRIAKKLVSYGDLIVEKERKHTTTPSHSGFNHTDIGNRSVVV